MSSLKQLFVSIYFPSMNRIKNVIEEVSVKFSFASRSIPAINKSRPSSIHKSLDSCMWLRIIAGALRANKVISMETRPSFFPVRNAPRFELAAADTRHAIV